MRGGAARAFRAIAALLIAAFAFNLQPPGGDMPFPAMPGASRASAQISFCGICCDADTACWERRRTDFERANPPRGMITGVCWAAQYRSERDPATGQMMTRFQNRIFSRVRFNETEVLAQEHHRRNAGFEFEVGTAWNDFLNANYPAAGDGWTWSKRCVSLSSPRGTEDTEWAKVQEAARYERVFLPTYGIADTPEERAAEARAAKERAAREAEQARIAAVEKAKQDAIEAEKRAEAARKAEAARIEAARVEAERQRRITAMQEQLGGPGKRAAAERLAAENEALKALRPKPPGKVTAFVVCYLYGKYDDGTNRQWQFYISQVGQMETGTGEAWPDSPKDPIAKLWGSYLGQRRADVDAFAKPPAQNFPTCQGFKTAAEAQSNRTRWLSDIRGGKGGYFVHEENWAPR